MPYILTKELAQQAFGLVEPVFHRLVADGIADGRKTLHVVILNPNSGLPLYEETWGEPITEESRPYGKIANAKAELVYKTGMVGRSLQADAPWLYETGDVRYAGGVIENQLIVAASGLQDYWDEAISWMVLSAVQGLCRGFMAGVKREDPAFFQ